MKGNILITKNWMSKLTLSQNFSRISDFNLQITVLSHKQENDRMDIFLL